MRWHHLENDPLRVYSQKMCCRGGQDLTHAGSQTWSWEKSPQCFSRLPEIMELMENSSMRPWKHSTNGSLRPRKQSKPWDWRGHVEKFKLGSIKGSQERLWWKHSPVAGWKPACWRYQSCGMTTKHSGSYRVKSAQPRRQVVYVADSGVREVTKYFGCHEWTPDTGHLVIYNTEFGFCFAEIVTVS